VAEDRIIPICNRKSLARALALIALVAPLVPVAAQSGGNPLTDYARARVADASGSIEEAARGYAAALAEAPNDATLATRAYRRAVAAGDQSLALRAATSLRQADSLPPDGQFLFLIEALNDGDWREARRIVDQIEEQSLFESLTPVLRAWITHGARDGDPLAILDAGPESVISTAYVSEHRALLLLAVGRYDEGIAAVRGLRDLGPSRFLRIRLAAAARLARVRRRDDALALLDGNSRAEQSARATLERNRRLPGSVSSASDGIAEIFIRLAADVNSRNVTALALTLSRFANFLSPDNSVGWLITSAILDSSDQNDAALVALSHIRARDPFYAAAQDGRVQLLAETDNPEAALALARAQTEHRNATAADWQRYGERYAALERHEEAALAYERALALSGGENAPWSAWLLYGGALLEADRWSESRPVLERAVSLAPRQPLALNYLGYALLERRENLGRAEELIRLASELRPDNASITDSLGWVYFLQGDLDRAIPTLERASVGDPDEPTINEHLGDAYWSAGRRRDARFAWQAALVSAETTAADRIRMKLDIGLTAETASP
jgi:tetratricopeptide (TPR) repeat protein